MILNILDIDVSHPPSLLLSGEHFAPCVRVSVSVFCVRLLVCLFAWVHIRNLGPQDAQKHQSIVGLYPAC